MLRDRKTVIQGTFLPRQEKISFKPNHTAGCSSGSGSSSSSRSGDATLRKSRVWVAEPRSILENVDEELDPDILAGSATGTDV